MMKNIGGRLVDMSEAEFEYFQELTAALGEEVFHGLMVSDAEGRIIAVTPSTGEPTSMLAIFFVMNLMLNQRLRAIDYGTEKINELENKLLELEKKVEK